jgi:hypothetical protein
LAAGKEWLSLLFPKLGLQRHQQFTNMEWLRHSSADIMRESKQIRDTWATDAGVGGMSVIEPDAIVTFDSHRKRKGKEPAPTDPGVRLQDLRER